MAVTFFKFVIVILAFANYQYISARYAPLAVGISRRAFGSRAFNPVQSQMINWNENTITDGSPISLQSTYGIPQTSNNYGLNIEGTTRSGMNFYDIIVALQNEYNAGNIKGMPGNLILDLMSILQNSNIGPTGYTQMYPNFLDNKNLGFLGGTFDISKTTNPIKSFTYNMGGMSAVSPFYNPFYGYNPTYSPVIPNSSFGFMYGNTDPNQLPTQFNYGTSDILSAPSSYNNNLGSSILDMSDRNYFNGRYSLNQTPTSNANSYLVSMGSLSSPSRSPIHETAASGSGVIDKGLLSTDDSIKSGDTK